VELNSIYDKFLNQLRKLPLYGLKKISLKLAAFLKELTEVLTPMSLVPVTMPVSSLFGKFSDYRF
jgi:hypothetical protein